MRIGVDLNCQTEAVVGRNLWQRTQCRCVHSAGVHTVPVCSLFFFLIFCFVSRKPQDLRGKRHVEHKRRGTFWLQYGGFCS